MVFGFVLDHDLHARGAVISEEQPLARIDFFVGPALHGEEDAAPAVVMMPYDVLGALWSRDQGAWQAVIAICEMHIQGEC